MKNKVLKKLKYKPPAETHYGPNHLLNMDLFTRIVILFRLTFLINFAESPIVDLCRVPDISDLL